MSVFPLKKKNRENVPAIPVETVSISGRKLREIEKRLTEARLFIWDTVERRGMLFKKTRLKLYKASVNESLDDVFCFEFFYYVFESLCRVCVVTAAVNIYCGESVLGPCVNRDVALKDYS